MVVFNLAEELEKERKKNEELKKQLKMQNEYTKYLPEGVEYILLTKATYDTQQNELQDQVFYLEDRTHYYEDKTFELQDRIDKAIEYIENDLQSFLYSIEYKTLLDILKGDNK